MASVNDLIKTAMTTRWSLTDDFTFEFHNQKYQFTGSQYPTNDIWELCVNGVDIPQVTGTVETVLQGGEYRLYSRKFSPFRITVSFRDIEGMRLKEYFQKIWADQQTSYFDEIKSTVTVYNRGILVFQSQNCLIESVSQSQFDQSNNQIVEFSVEFVTPTITTKNLENFGKQS